MLTLLTRISMACLFATAMALSAHGQVEMFFDQAEFEAALMGSGAMLETVDFENSNVNSDDVIGFPDMTPLEFGVPLLDQGGAGFPMGLSNPLLRIRATGPVREGLVIFGENALVALDDDNQGISPPSPSVGPLDFNDALMIEIQDTGIVGIGFELTGSDPFGVGTDSYSLTVVDLEGVEILDMEISEFGFTGFLGLFVEANEFGSVTVDNIFGMASFAGEVIGDMQIWTTPTSFVLGDINCDGVVNLLDVSPFVDLLSNNGFSAKADINTDGVVNLLDVSPFVDLLTGG